MVKKDDQCALTIKPFNLSSLAGENIQQGRIRVSLGIDTFAALLYLFFLFAELLFN